MNEQRGAATTPRFDPLSPPPQLLLVYFDVPPARAAWFVQPASFTLVGVLAVSSVRGFLTSLARLASFGGALSGGGDALGGEGGEGAGGAGGGSSSGAAGTAVASDGGGGGGGAISRDAIHSAAALLVAELLGTYILSTILLLRMSLPEEYRAGITAAVGDIHFNFFHRWFDVIFVLAACTAIIGHVVAAANRSARLGAALGGAGSAGAAAAGGAGGVGTGGGSNGGGSGGGGAGASSGAAARPTASSRSSSAGDEARVTVSAVGGGVRAPDPSRLQHRSAAAAAAAAVPQSPRAERDRGRAADRGRGSRANSALDSPRRSPGRYV